MAITLCALLRINYRGASLDVGKPVRILCNNSIRDDCPLDKGSSTGGAEKWTESWYFEGKAGMICCWIRYEVSEKEKSCE